ncbi:dihydrodipicolinate synthase family protein [Brucella pseudogrignonensis]|uniref:dihydrodipicolinate synthase family protein n=1 Tax=Brucella pseudogrignonensis TaxID=419475 RepID=UPI003D98D17C
MKSSLLTANGVSVIAVTPFDRNGQIDAFSVEMMIDFYIDKGANGLTILGMMGEAQKLTLEEAINFTSLVIRKAANVPVIVGASFSGFASMKELVRAAMDNGAAGIMIAPTPNLRTDDQIVGYYQLVADELGTEVPLVVQDYPLGTGVSMSTSTLGCIIETIDSVVMLKHEDWPGLSKISTLRSDEENGRRRIAIFTGNGGMFLPEELMRGADGAMTGFSYPEMMVQVCNLIKRGEIDHAQDCFDAYLPFARYEQQQGLGLAARKYVLAKRGAIRFATVRSPGPKLSAADRNDIDRLLARQERRLRELEL